MANSRLICFVDQLDSQYVSRSLAGMKEALSTAGWEIEVREGGILTWEARMAMLRAEAHSGENQAAAFVHFHLTDDQAAIFKSAKIPLGYLGGTLEGVDSVLDDGNEGAYLGASHLAELGHRRIALLVGDLQVTESRMREIGFHRALQERSISVAKTMIVEVKPALPYEAQQATLKLMSGQSTPSAIFCAAGDLAATGVYKAAAQLNLQIPRDLSVLGYDDIPAAGAMHPPLSTLRQPLEAMGRQLAAQLIKAAADKTSHVSFEAMIKPALEARESSAAPAAK